MSTPPKIADKISQAEAAFTAIRAERSQLDVREIQVNARAEQIATHELPAAKQAHEDARITADPKDDLTASSKLANLQRELANCAATVNGITTKRQQLVLAETRAATALERARASKELDQAHELGKAAKALFGDAFEVLGELVIGSIKPAITHLNRDDARGVKEAFDEGALARWIITEALKAGVDLHIAGATAMHLQGTDPECTAQNVVSVVETL